MNKEIKRPFVIAIDFDGTVCEDRYPEIGNEFGPAIEYLTRHLPKNTRLILHTMREGDSLEAALRWLADRGIIIWSANKNPLYPWSECRKVYADVYIDDRMAASFRFGEYSSWRKIQKLVWNRFKNQKGQGLRPIIYESEVNEKH